MFCIARSFLPKYHYTANKAQQERERDQTYQPQNKPTRPMLNIHAGDHHATNVLLLSLKIGIHTHIKKERKKTFLSPAQM